MNVGNTNAPPHYLEWIGMHTLWVSVWWIARMVMGVAHVSIPDSKVYGGQHGVYLGPAGSRWAPCCPHEPCYLGFPLFDVQTDHHRWGFLLSLFADALMAMMMKNKKQNALWCYNTTFMIVGLICQRVSFIQCYWSTIDTRGAAAITTNRHWSAVWMTCSYKCALFRYSFI